MHSAREKRGRFLWKNWFLEKRKTKFELEIFLNYSILLQNIDWAASDEAILALSEC